MICRCRLFDLSLPALSYETVMENVKNILSMKFHPIISAALIIPLVCSCARITPADYVNPFIGASTSTDLAGVYHGLGKTFPGATTPWGMVQVSPNTITGGDNGPGYSYEHETLEGFAFTQMSGIGWYGDFGNLLVMPTTGPMYKTAGLADGSVKGWRSHFDKSTETAEAGYYAARLTDYDIRVEASAAPHSGILQFTFPECEDSRIQIDLARRVGGSSTRQHVRVVDRHTIEGWMYCPPEGGGWGHGGGKADYTVYFHARFSRPFTDYGFWSADIPAGMTFHRDEMVSREFLDKVSEAELVTETDSLDGTHIGFYTQFPTQKDERITLRVGISYVDIQGARNNLRSEIADKSFERVRSEARALWNDALGRMEIRGGTDDERTIFYTALYHTMIDPRIFADVDGRYVGGDGAIHSPNHDFVKRTIFSGWDVFRSQMPLATLVYPEVTHDLINTLITLADESGKGYFERWEIVNAYSGCMVGHPALSVVADAYAKGISDFDAERALEIGERTSATGIDPALGYNPGSISTTLEDAYGDWCLGRFAEMTGHEEIAARYYENSMAYKRIFDAEKKWFRPRLEDGRWMEWPANGRLTDGYGCVESNAYQQGWFVPHDIDGLVELLGGREAALADLTAFFEATPDDFHWNSYYNHANEPVHHIPFLFNRLGAPWLTQQWTRKICANAYRNCVEGLVGNEDCGQMSAWYVLAACGIHPVCPGETTYEITSPVFDEVKIRVADGKTFVIKAENNSPTDIYIQTAELNGQSLSRLQLDHADIVKGGELILRMGAEPVGR